MSKGKKRVIIFLSLFFVVLLLVTFQYKGKSFGFLVTLSYPFDALNNFTTTVNMTITEVWNTFGENRRLEDKLSAALLQIQRHDEIVRENKRLREILLLRDSSPNYIATARVIARGPDRLLNTILIDKGESSGIKEDMAVITTKGLVGRVHSVRGNFSEVLLLRDPNFSVAVRLQDSRREGIISGTGHRYSLLEHIPFEEVVEKGDNVVTSGLDSIFPPGIPVGVVSRVRAGDHKFFQSIQVLPFQTDTKIEEVVILTNAGASP
ncbi:rod shape-determining protein MreC [Thermodesulfovibrionales bacterium]|nr:rod shape-determining protein MreC [Thermodesulfovibrionales bacterium]